MRKTMITMTLATLLTACSTTSGTGPDIYTSGFDNSTLAEIAPHGAACTTACLGLGAQWNEAHGDEAFLIVANFMDLVAILDAQLNIDGKIVDLEPADLLTGQETNSGVRTSTKGFRTTLETIEAITKAKRVWLRIETPTGTREDRIIDASGDSKAYHAMKRFISAVKSVD